MGLCGACGGYSVKVRDEKDDGDAETENGGGLCWVSIV